VLNQFAGPGECAESSRDAVAVRLAAGNTGLAAVIRAIDAERIELAHLQLHAPTLDDVFLAKTGRSLEGSGEEGEVAGEQAPAEPLTA
jgi:ABC-2 type transport system ATP-binding protein